MPRASDQSALEEFPQNDESGEPVIEQCQNQSSGVGSSLAIADGLAVVPPHTEVSAGDLLEYISFSELLR